MSEYKLIEVEWPELGRGYAAGWLTKGCPIECSRACRDCRWFRDFEASGTYLGACPVGAEDKLATHARCAYEVEKKCPTCDDLGSVLPVDTERKASDPIVTIRVRPCPTCRGKDD